MTTAQIISVNMSEDDAGVPRANQTLLMNDTAGALAFEAINWNNALFTTGALSNLMDVNGTPTGANVTWPTSPGGGWGDGTANADADAGIPNAKLQRGYIDDNGTGSTAVIDVTGIPYANYGLVLYASSDNPGQLHGDFSINGAPAVTGGTAINWADQPTLDVDRNVLVFPGLSGPTLNIVGTRVTGTRASISGFQIIENLVPPEPDPVLLIDRGTGDMTFSNPASIPFDFSGYAVLSDNGAIQSDNWNSITDNGASGGLTTSDSWLEFASSANEIAEGTLGSGSVAMSNSFSLGSGVWNRYFLEDEDLRFEILDLDGNTIEAEVVFSGGPTGEQYPEGDFTFDGMLTAADWPTVRNAFNTTFPAGTSIVEAYQGGDLTRDLRVDLDDLLAFEALYDAEFGAGAFAQLVPEPGSCFLLGLGGLALMGLRRRRGLGTLLTLLVLASFVIHLIPSGELRADPIPVSNHSFEDAALGSGVWSDCIDVACGQTDPDDWADDPLNGTDAFAEVIDGFSADGTHHLGIQRAGHRVTQNLTGVTLMPNTVYTLTPAVGNRDLAAGTGNATVFGLSAGGTVLNRLQRDDASLIPQLTYEDRRYVYVSGNSPPSGELGIVLGTDGGNRAHFDNIRLDASPVETYTDLLSLDVDTATGSVTLKNNAGFMPMDINYYEISSPSGSLVFNNWNSLFDQDLPGFPAGTNDMGNGWEELGNLDNSLVAEFYLQSNSTMAAGTSIGLGNLFNTGGSQDLTLFYHLDDGRSFPGPVFYSAGLSPDLDGSGDIGCGDMELLYDEIFAGTNGAAFDFDGDGMVDNDDIDAWLATASSFAGKDYRAGDGDLDGDVDGPDFTNLAVNFGNSDANPANGAYWCDGNFDGVSNGQFVVGGTDFTALAFNFGHVSVSAVPEPADFALLGVMGLLSVFFLRRERR